VHNVGGYYLPLVQYSWHASEVYICEHHMMISSFDRLIGLLLAVMALFEHVTAVDTVPQLNISQYLGTWYQVALLLRIVTFYVLGDGHASVLSMPFNSRFQYI